MNTKFSRRDFLLTTAGGALAAQFWPGNVFAYEAKGENGAFEFIQVNDLHYADEKLCPPWFEKAFALMRECAPKAEFVLMTGDLANDAKDDQFSGLPLVSRIFSELFT